MDETTLSDLLECSVCLEQLDIASKVLPCQHTFCRKCLEVIVASKKELKCPECRIVVKLPIDELPPNVLLVRILEGMKNSASMKANNKKISRNVDAIQPDNSEKFQTSDVTKQTLNVNEKREVDTNLKQASEVKRYSLGNVPHQKRYILPHAYAIYDFSKNEPNILSFKKGDLILLKGNIDKDWCLGQCNGKEGKFPIKFVKIVVPLPSPQCIALYDFKMAPNEDEGCLSFKKGTIIQVIRRVDQNWAEGSIGTNIGIFPIAFVELNNLAKQTLMQSNKTSEIKQHIPKHLENPNHNISVQNDQNFNSNHFNGNITNQMNRETIRNSTNYSMNPSRSVDSLYSQPKCPYQSIRPDEKHTPDNIFNANDSVPFRDSKRHSLHSLVSSQNSNAVNLNRYSAEILSAPSTCNTNENNIRAQQVVTPKLPWNAVALYPYKPKNRDELELMKGCIYIVTEICLDGWYKGKNKNEEFGVFPGNYVAPLSYVEQCKYTLDTKRSPQNLPPAGSTLLNPKSLSKSLNFLEMTNNRYELHLPTLPPRTTFHETSTPLTGNIVENTQESSTNSNHNTLPDNTIQPLQELKEEELRTKNNCSLGALNLMKRLANMKYQNKSKTAPRSKTYQNNLTENVKSKDMQDNYNTKKTLEQNNLNNNASSTLKAIHIRSGSCPSQLLQTNALHVNGEMFRDNVHLQKTLRSPILFASNSQRHKVKERPTIVGRKSLDGASLNLINSKSINTNHRNSLDEPQNASGPCIISHRKSSSFDASHMSNTNSSQMLSHYAESVSSIKAENRFRCIVPYPPNSDIELELHIGDIVYVQRKQKNGWYKGTHSITNKTGLFPASFVELDT